MADLASMSKHELLEVAQRAKGSLKRIRENAEGAGERLMGVMAVNGGAATSGVVRALLGDAKGEVNIPGTEVDAMLLVGTAGQLGAIAGVFGKQSTNMAMFFGGIAAPAVERFAFDMAKRK